MQYILNPYSDKLREERRKQKVQKVWVLIILILSTISYEPPQPEISMPVPSVQVRYSNDEHEAALVSTVHAAPPEDQRKDNSGVRPEVVPARKDSVSKIVSTIYQLESSSGQNDSCRASGQYNGYGFSPGTCYKSHAIVTGHVTRWIEQHLKSNSLPTVLCSYNLGPKSPHLGDCIAQSEEYPYYRNFLSISNN